MMLLPLLAGLLNSAFAAEDVVHPELPTSVAESCAADERAATGLVHLRCGETRMLVAQLRTVEADVHDELLRSVQELVPPPVVRTEVPLADDDLRRTTLVQRRNDASRGELTVHLQLTTRLSSGRSVACMVGLTDRKRADRKEIGWCETVEAALMPPPTAAVTTQVSVQEPDLPPDGLPRR